MASASEVERVGRPCGACTYLCEDAQRVHCELCGCELPLLQSCRPLQLPQQLPKAQQQQDPLPTAKRERVSCSWKADDGKDCKWSGRKCDLLAHQRNAKCHIKRRATEARDKAAAGGFFSRFAGRSSVSWSSFNVESSASPSITDQGSCEPVGDRESCSTTTTTSTTSERQPATFAWLHGIITSLAQGVRSVSTSIQAQPEAVADAVMLRLDEREREREQERVKDAATRAAEKANSDLDKQLAECKQAEDFHGVGFKYNPLAQELYCDTCIRFRHLVHSSQICFYNNARFGKVHLNHFALRVFCFLVCCCHSTRTLLRSSLWRPPVLYLPALRTVQLSTRVSCATCCAQTE